MEEMRKAIAAAMTRAKRTIPHFYLSETIDVDPAIRFLEERNADRPPTERVLLGAVFVRAATIAASKVPVMNGHFTEEAGYQPSDTVNPGVAVALRGGGLVAPALMDAVDMSLDDTMAGMRDLVSRARAGRLRSSEMTMGTITVSSLGDTGAEAMTGVIFPPQVALIGLGAPHLRPWVVDGDCPPPCRDPDRLRRSPRQRRSAGGPFHRRFRGGRSIARGAMTMTDFRAVFLGGTHPRRPGHRAADVGDDDHIQDDLDLDSMDVLNLVSALHERLGVDIPERDYPEIATLARAADYLASRV
jgi:acyl carrier protein